MEVGDTLELVIGDIAHGGHFVARHDGQVVFVRHAAPGERVRAVVTKIGKAGRLAFADCVEVLAPSTERVAAPCPYAGQCGGCDFQHLNLAYQRELKTRVLREQLQRLGGWVADDPRLGVAVVPLDPAETGSGWRTRVRYATDHRGRIGLRRHGSKEVVAVDRCRLAVDEIASGPEIHRPWPANSEVIAAAAADGAAVQSVEAERQILHERVGEFRFEVASTGFWQAHQLAPQRFTDSVLRMAAPKLGQHIVDLYAGVGLFALPLAAAIGLGGRLDAVEGDRTAGKLLARNLRTQAQAKSAVGDVGQWLQRGQLRRCDTVVLDPPRVGAGDKVLAAIAKLTPSTIVYVACDPAAFARDVRILRELGYELEQIEAWDAFPMTHHFETIAKFTPARIPR